MVRRTQIKQEAGTDVFLEYQCLEIERLNAILQKRGVDENTRREICNQFFFHTGSFLDDGEGIYVPGKKNGKIFYPQIHFVERLEDEEDDFVISSIHTVPKSFAFHEYAHSSVKSVLGGDWSPGARWTPPERAFKRKWDVQVILVTADMSVPSPNQWLDWCQEWKCDATWRKKGGGAIALDAVPQNYEGLYLQAVNRLDQNENGICFYKCRPEGDGFLLDVELVDYALAGLWENMLRYFQGLDAKFIRGPHPPNYKGKD